MSQNSRNFQDEFERLGHRLTLFGFAVVIIIIIAAPIVALSWRNHPFLGVFVEQTLVVNDNKGEDWGGLLAGISSGERVVRIGGFAVATPKEYDAALATFKAGDQVVVFTHMPDGSGRLYPKVTLGKLSAPDFLRFFWLPYLIGLFYLGIGVWIYRARGNTRSGLALAIFCVLTGAVCGLIFDLSTSHIVTEIWSTALALTGASLISLAMCFPQEWGVLHKRIWVLALPYSVSVPLIVWNLRVYNDVFHPWAYWDSWRGNYLFTTLGILFFIGSALYQAWRSASPVVRRQSRIVLLGSGLAFLPLMFWFLAPMFHLPVKFNVSLFLPPLVFFPLSISIAILRFHLLEVDALFNRALVYGLLTAVLAGMFTALTTISQRLFMALTGEKSDIAIIITTLIVGSAFAPVRTRLQGFVDRQFKELPDHTRSLQAFGAQVNAYVEMRNAQQLTLRLLKEAAEAYHAESGALALFNGDQSVPKIVHTYKQWKGEVLVNIPLEANGTRYGFLMLGPRVDDRPYTQHEYQVLNQVAGHIAAAINLGERK